MSNVPGLDEQSLARLTSLMQADGLIGTDDELAVRLISGGRSNITYGVKSATGNWVLRRPPLGHVLSTAHDMNREYRVLTGLAQTKGAIPVPTPALMCHREDVLGAPFYLMEHIEGVVLRTVEEASSLSPDQQVAVANDMIDVLADLHQVDPSAVGLGEFGRPDGFMSRQVARWTRQLSDSRSRDLDAIEQLAEDLSATIPEQLHSSIVHGDYRLDNCIVRDGSVAAVLDWEMATLGDPFSDLGLFAVYYSGFSGTLNPVVQSIAGVGSYPTLDQLLDRYANRTGRDVSSLDWYIAFAWFKFAVILEGIHYRSTLGATLGPGFDGVSELVQPSVYRGRAALAGRGGR